MVLTCWDGVVPGRGTARGSRGDGGALAAEERAGEVAPAKQLGKALRALQQRSGRTLRSLEAEVLISDSSLSRYLQGVTVPPWATVTHLCRALGADPSEYRALWEAANLSQTPSGENPPSAAAPPPVDGGDSRPRTAQRWRRGRWVTAAAGVLVGGVVGSLFTVLVAAPGPEPARPSSGSAAVTGPANKPGRSDAVQPFINRVTGKCLDHSLDHGLRTYACNGLSYQRWTVHALPDGTQQLRNHATGACLRSEGMTLRTGACATAPSATWSVRTWADEAVTISSTETGACLEDSASGLRAAECGDTTRQRWG